jgi:hypothetical protein
MSVASSAAAPSSHTMQRLLPDSPEAATTRHAAHITRITKSYEQCMVGVHKAAANNLNYRLKAMRLKEAYLADIRIATDEMLSNFRTLKIEGL